MRSGTGRSLRLVNMPEAPSPRPSPRGGGRSEAEGEGQRRWGIVRLMDFGEVAANDWLAVNQFTVIEGAGSSPPGKGGREGIGAHRRPDLVVFVNGLPLGLIELKNASDEGATIWSAYAQVQTYKAEIPSLLHYNAALVLSDGLQARIGSLTANQEWFKEFMASLRKSASSSCCSISSSSRKTRTRGRCTRSSRATINSTR